MNFGLRKPLCVFIEITTYTVEMISSRLHAQRFGVTFPLEHSGDNFIAVNKTSRGVLGDQIDIFN